MGAVTIPSHTKATREDWLAAAMEVLISGGEEQVKVLPLADHLGVSRSSFYWYFNSRRELLDQLLAHWRATNTSAIIAHADLGAPTIGAAVCNVWRAMIDPEVFHNPLDFAVREWGRRAAPVRRVVEQSDTARIEAIAAMFARFGYGETEALARARTLYYMQIGYNDAELQEPMEDRLRMVPYYILTFTGRPAAPGDADLLEAFAKEGNAT